MPTIMIVEDDPDLREAIVDTLELSDYQVIQCESAEAAVAMLAKKNRIDLVISDVNMGVMSGHDLLHHVQDKFAHIPMVLVTAYASINDSVEAIKQGAADYLVKPLETEALLGLVEKILGKKTSLSDEPIACAEGSKQLLALATRVAKSDTTALIVGESGTGKEVLARFIHLKSPRAEKPFVAINCAAIPENMLEAILFGYEKGAYTGASQATPGKFEQANGGTILLDEISEMDISLQAKLLRVLQEKEVERLGSRRSIKLDVRVIATSNRDMRSEVAAGNFREDLYFRLSVLPLQWAPLRDRREDIIPLAQSLLSKHAKKQHRKAVGFANSTMDRLTQYSWPGNVRELDNIIQRALILQSGKTIYPNDLGFQDHTSFSKKPSLLDADAQINGFGSQSAHAPDSSHADAHVHSDSDTTNYKDVAESALRVGTSPSDQSGLGDDLKKKEFEIIVKTLQEVNGSKKNTAAKLGISPRTLRYKLARFKAEGFAVPV